MAVIEQNPNVTLGDWRSDGNYATANRICTYADLVDKTLPVSGDVLHELGGSSNINNVYIINGRQTLTYLQLSHCEDLKVYLKTSSTTGEQHMYRFNGEVKQLCRFSCKETDSLNDNVPYKYNQCVNVSDIECIENTKEVRFRFKNITFRPCIKFIVGGSGVEWCSLVKVERENDLTNPHDIYIKMKNGLKAKFAIELYESQSGSEYIYIGSDGYYGGSIKEYDSSYGGAVNLTYTSYDSIIPPVDWLANQTQEFIVEPYLENAQVTLTGTRNTPIYIEIETDSRFTVRNMTHAKFAEACNDTYENQAEYGVLSVIPGDYAGYFMTPIADPGHAYVTLMSQDVNQWDRFEGTVEEYDTNGDPTHEQPWEIKLQSFSPEVPSAWAWGPMNWGIEIHKKCNGEKFVHKYSYKLKLISKAAFYPTTVNVVEWRDLSIKYLPSETEIIDVSSQPSGQKWIHTFYTKETETPQNITLKAIVKSDSIEAGEMGYNATYAIVKVSLSTNQNNKLVSFDSNGGVGPGAYAVVPYVHSSSIMPRSLELYMRVLPNVTVNFMFPNGYQVQKEGGSYESGEPINAYYNTVQLQFDAETVQSEKITISIKRNQAGNHGYNYLTPSFYYNSSWTGGVALEVTFSGLSGKTFDVGQSTAVIANHVSFALGTTEFSIRFAGSQRSALALTFIIPSFRSGCLNNYAEVAPAADSTEIGGKGGYFGPMLVEQEQIEGSCAIYQGNSNELIVSADGRPDSWIGATGYSYSFDITDTLIKIVPKTLSGVATIQNGYLPSTIYKEVTATGNDLTVESTPRTLTSSIYEPLTYSSTSPMFKFTINSGASAPAATLTAVKWSDTDIYIFSMNKDIEGENGYFDIRGITSGSEGTAGTKFNFSTTAASVPTSYSGSETNHLKYTFVLPDWFYGIKNGHKRTFRMDMNRSIWAGKQNTATGGTHLKGIEKYRIVAYREYNPNGSSGSQIFDKTLDCTGDYTEFRLDNLTTDENIFNIASNLGRPMALVIIPIEGEPLMNISGILWWNGTSMQSSTYNQDPVYLSPIMRENSIEINIKCKNASDVVKVSFDGTTFNSGYGVTVDDGHTVFATVEKLTGSSNTHKVTVWTDDDLYNYNDGLTGNKPYYTNKNIPIIIRYASSASPVDLTVNLTVGPVIDFEFYGPTYVSQNPATTSGTFTTKVLEYIKNGSNDNGILQTVCPSYPAYDPTAGTDREETVYVPDQANWITKYDFKWCKWSGSGSSDTFTTYFLNPINGTVNGEYTLRSKDTFPGSEELIPTGTVDAFVEYTYHPLNIDAWYPNANSHKVTAQVQNYMSVAGIHFMTDPTQSSGYYHGAMSFSEAYMPPVFFTANPSAYTLKIYLAFVNPSELQLNTAVFKLGNGSTYTSEFETSTELNTDGTQIDTTVGTQTYHRDWQLMVKVRIKSGVNLADVNDRICFQPSSSHPENARYWTGMQVPFELSIRKVVTSQTFNTSFSVPLGPVINMYTINDGKLEPSNNHIISTDSVIKPETGESHLVRIRAREWIHNGTTPWEASGYCGTINGRSYYVQFNYNDTEIPNYPTGNTSSPQRRLNTNFDINCPVNWTDINGNTYQPDGSPDWGAWKIDVINDSGLATIGSMDISMNISGGSEMKSWYPAKSMKVDVQNFIELHVTSVEFREDDEDYSVHVWDENQSGPILIPGFGVYQDGPWRNNGDIKIYVAGTPLTTYPNAFPWVYFKPLGNTTPSASNIVVPDSDFDERSDNFQFGYYFEDEEHGLDWYDILVEKDVEHPTEYINESSTYQLILQLRDSTNYSVLYAAATPYEFKFEHVEGLYPEGRSYDSTATAGIYHSATITFEHEYINSIASTGEIMPTTGDRRLTIDRLSGEYYDPDTTSIFYSTTDTQQNTLNLGVKHMSPLKSGFYLTGHTKYNEFKMYINNGTANATKYLHIIRNANNQVAMTGNLYFTTNPRGAQFVASLNGDSSTPSEAERVPLKRYGMRYITSGTYTGWSYFTITVKQYLNPNGGWNYYFIDGLGNTILNIYQPLMLNDATNMSHYNSRIDYPMLPFSSIDERYMLNSALGAHKASVGDEAIVVEDYIYPVFTSESYGSGPSAYSSVYNIAGISTDNTLQPSDYNHSDFWPTNREDHPAPSVVSGYRQYPGWHYYTPQTYSGSQRSWDNGWRFALPTNSSSAGSWFNTLSTQSNGETIITSGSFSGNGIIYCA